MIEKIDKRIRLMQYDIQELNKKVDVLFNAERRGLFAQTIIPDNYLWTRVSAIPIYTGFKLIEFKPYSEAEFTFDKKEWLKSEISTNEKSPTVLGNMYQGTINMYLDKDGFLNILMSRTGNNNPTHVVTLAR